MGDKQITKTEKRPKVSYTDGRKPDGSPNRIFFYGKTMKEAKDKREAYKRNRLLGLTASSRSMTVSEWVDKWTTVYKVNEADYGYYIKKLKRDLGRLPIQAICEADLVKSLNSYSGKSKSSASKYRMIVKRIFHKALKNRLIVSDPSEDLELPDETTEGSHRALDKWECDMILDNWQAYNAGFWAMLMMLCGLRRGEMIALNWEQIDLKNRTITIHAAAVVRQNQPVVKDKTKTKAGMRILPICQPLYDALVETPEDKRHGPVCLSKHGKRLSQSAFKRGWTTFNNVMTRLANGERGIQQGRRWDKENNRDVEKEGQIVFSVRAHDLRHTYATALYDAGVDIKSAQYYLGHDDIAMTQKLYTHLSQERENKSRSELVSYLDTWIKSGDTSTKNGSGGQNVVISEADSQKSQ